MKIEYLNLYKFDKLEDGTPEKMNGRLDALAWELSIRTKFGCADISMSFYMPKEMFTLERQIECKNAKKEYRLRSKKLEELIDLIKSSVKSDIKFCDEYLYELWISKLFEIDWINGDPLYELEKLKEKLLEDNLINPFDIVLEKTKDEISKKRKLLGIFNKKSNI